MIKAIPYQSALPFENVLDVPTIHAWYKTQRVQKKENLNIMSHHVNNKEESKSDKQLPKKKKCKKKKKSEEVKCMLYKTIISI